MHQETRMHPIVAVVMGSRSDWETMRHAAEALEALGVPHEAEVVSAHRTPDRLFEFAERAAARGLRIRTPPAGGGKVLNTSEKLHQPDVPQSRVANANRRIAAMSAAANRITVSRAVAPRWSGLPATRSTDRTTPPDTPRDCLAAGPGR